MDFSKQLRELERAAERCKKSAFAGAHRCRPLLAETRNKALTGIVVAIPLIATVWVVKLAYGFIRDISAPFLSGIGIDWPILPFFVTVALLTGLGFMATNLMGQRILQSVEQTLLKIPFVATIYAGVKQVIDSFKSFNNMSNFKRVVYLDYPSDGARLIGFVTGQYYDANLQEEMTSVVVPTAPNPMTGLVVVVPSRKLIDSSLTLEEAMKMVVSAGLVVPKRRPLVAADGAVIVEPPSTPPGV